MKEGKEKMELNALAAAADLPLEATKKEDPNALGQEDFLRMLLTQLEHQDPLEPQDPTEFTAQLAQFTTLEQLVAIRAGIDKLGDESASASDLASLASLVGREVAVRGDRVSLDGRGTPAPLGLDLDAPAARVRVSLMDAQGRLAHSFDAGPFEAGRQDLAWSGLTTGGNPLPAGDYSIRAESLNGNNATRVGTIVRGRVRAVEPNADGTASLDLGALRATSSDVLEVREAGARAMMPALHEMMSTPRLPGMPEATPLRPSLPPMLENLEVGS